MMTLAPVRFMIVLREEPETASSALQSNKKFCVTGRTEIAQIRRFSITEIPKKGNSFEIKQKNLIY